VRRDGKRHVDHAQKTTSKWRLHEKIGISNQLLAETMHVRYLSCADGRHDRSGAMMTYQTLESAIRAYCHAQRFAGAIGAIVALLMFIVAATLFWRGDAFVRGLSIVLMVIALAGGSCCATLAMRGAPRADAMMRVRDGFSIAQEAARMERVINRYRYYHVALAGVAFTAVMLLLLTLAPTWQGVAVGMLLLAGLGITFEHFDRQQAIMYLAALKPSRCV
jgi:hypothetical protein